MFTLTGRTSNSNILKKYKKLLNVKKNCLFVLIFQLYSKICFAILSENGIKLTVECTRLSKNASITDVEMTVKNKQFLIFVAIQVLRPSYRNTCTICIDKFSNVNNARPLRQKRSIELWILFLAHFSVKKNINDGNITVTEN